VLENLLQQLTSFRVRHFIIPDCKKLKVQCSEAFNDITLIQSFVKIGQMFKKLDSRDTEPDTHKQHDHISLLSFLKNG
jgi:hypothetical protein